MTKEREILERFQEAKKLSELRQIQPIEEHIYIVPDETEDWREAQIEATRADIARIEAIEIREAEREEIPPAREIMQQDAERILPANILKQVQERK